MKSCIYECKVMHQRSEPIKHGFTYKLFMFYLDLDELDIIPKHVKWISRNRWNVFSFFDKNHLQYPKEKPETNKDVKEQILTYLHAKGIDLKGGKIMLLTHLTTWGYQFNPVSFYYCFDEKKHPVCVVAEVSNTFREMKPYLIQSFLEKEERFEHREIKHFYVSPFIDMDAEFDFKLRIPNESLHIKIDDFKADKSFFKSTLWGKKKPLTNAKVAWYAIRFPMITLRIMWLIHWNAFVLWLKRIPFYAKKSHPELQRDIYRPLSH